MAGRLAIDFGTSNTVLALWDSIQQKGVPYALTDYARFVQVADERICVIPSLVNFAADGKLSYGQQVFQRNLTHSGNTFQWMKRYIAMRHPGKRNINDKMISHFDAAEAFLLQIIKSAACELELQDEEVAFTVPVEAFEHYENWLYELARKAGIINPRFIDEPSAAALGYSARLFANDAYLVFDFGAGTLDVSIVKQEQDEDNKSGRCRVLGKAGAELGGSSIDEWIFQDVLLLNGLSDADPEVQQISRLLLSECEALKEKLSFVEKADLTVMNPLTGSVISVHYSRQQLEALLDKHDAFAKIDQTIRRALNSARERGFDEESIKMVLMVGGCSQIPCVQNTLRRIFGRERIKMERPLDAVSRGAAAFIAGETFDDFLQHSYAIRYLNPRSNSYEYRPVVSSGTAYPTKGPLDTFTVKAAHDGQEHLGLLIYEMGANGKSAQASMEIYFDDSGNARLSSVSTSEHEKRGAFCLNEKNPTFLIADPPALKGEARFELSFSIDSNRRLLISARDLKSGKLVHENCPLIKLS